MNRAIAEMRANALRARLEGTLNWMRERGDVMYDPKALDRMVRNVSLRESMRPGGPGRTPMSHLDVNLRVYDGESVPVSAVYQADVYGERLRVVIGEERLWVMGDPHAVVNVLRQAADRAAEALAEARRQEMHGEAVAS